VKIIVLFLLAFPMAHATGTVTHFNDVLAMYSAGTNVSWAEMRGSWAGRCYTWWQKDVPQGALLSYLADSHGPEFAEGLPKILAVVPAGDAEHFDELRPSQIFVAHYDLRIWQNGFANFTEVPTVSIELRENGALYARDSYRKTAEGYVVSVRTNLHAGSDLPVGGAERACYFFKKAE
jgi:hypothetical protein